MPLLLKKIWQFVKAVGATAYSGYPARRLKVIGVTGTDGKTTTVNLIYHILKTSGKKVSMISTVGAVIGNRKIETGFHTTTPDPITLQRYLKEAADKGSEYMGLEVSSHGLDQFRVFGCNFYLGILTNITHEHIDYHKTFKNYLMSKAKLFKNAKISILNKNDQSFNKLQKIIRSSRRNPEILFYPDPKLSSKIHGAISERFAEPYNFLNAEAAIKATDVLGIKESNIVRALKTFPGVPGRMQDIKNKKGLRIIVDFAHTPNGLKNVLNVLRKQKTKGSRLIAVLGCAGERDIEKRPLMGQISAEFADISVFTAEDPRHEDVNKIIDQMVRGVKRGSGRFYRIPKRGEAIHFAINKLAAKGDIVVICGKGPEKSMAYGDKEYLWSDYQAVKIAVKGGIKRIII